MKLPLTRLLLLLDHENPGVQAWALGHLRTRLDRASADALLDRLATTGLDDALLDRIMALDPDHFGARLMEALATASNDVAGNIAQALGRASYTAAIEPIRQRLRAPRMSLTEYIAFVRSLGALGDDAPLWRIPSGDVSRRAITSAHLNALAHAITPDRTGDLLRLMDDLGTSMDDHTALAVALAQWADVPEELRFLQTKNDEAATDLALRIADLLAVDVSLPPTLAAHLDADPAHWPRLLQARMAETPPAGPASRQEWTHALLAALDAHGQEHPLRHEYTALLTLTVAIQARADQDDAAWLRAQSDLQAALLSLLRSPRKDLDVDVVRRVADLGPEVLSALREALHDIDESYFGATRAA